MKGKASIILTDADSGRIVRRLEEKNIITNAVANVFNLPLECRINAINHSLMFTGALPIHDTLMGGILLLGNNVTEDADNIFLPPDAKIIATAGAAYSGTSPNIGTLNQNESCELDNGYRLTWDFATDKANDTIRCICLTGRQFGSSGAWTPDSSRGVIMGNLSNLTGLDTTTNGLAMFCGKGQYIYSKSATTHVFMTCTSDGKLQFTEQTSIDPQNLLINDVAGANVLCKQVAEYFVEPPFTFVYDRRFFFDPDKMYLYFFKEKVYDSAAEITKAEYIAVNLKNYSVAEHRQISLAGSYNYDYAAICYDSLFIISNQVLRRFSLDGTLIKEYTDEAVDAGFYAINGCLYTLATNNGLFMVTPESACRLSRTNGYNVSTVSCLKPPLVATAYRANHACNDSTVQTTHVFAQILNAYMASINNLSEPIRKTSAQTLKIIYEITN